jgi:leader peptidase (prepilin peptidase)/N-methyltransferase
MERQILNTILSLFSFAVGGVIGSFLNVCVYRIPRGESIINPGSHCPKCNNPIAWYDNIPMISWLALGARCRHCAEPISWQYPLVEAITATAFLLVFWRFGLLAATPIYMLLAAALVLVTFVDLTDWTIPDQVTIPGIILGLGCSLIAMFFPNSGLRIEHIHSDIVVIDSLLGILVGGITLYLLDKLTVLLLKKRGMGFGDVKLLAMLGAFTGWKGVILILVISSFVGSLIGITVVAVQRYRGAGEKDHYLPFGPYLSLAGFIVVLFGGDIVGAYLSFIGLAATGV